MPTLRQWITGESNINTKKTESKRNVTAKGKGRTRKALQKKYKQNQGTNRGYGINKR